MGGWAQRWTTERFSLRWWPPTGSVLRRCSRPVLVIRLRPQVLFLTNPAPATGDYRLGGLPTGDYLVQFSGDRKNVV